ncbi:MAG: hypothetical protein K0Q73_5805 [Paenibacillus sp.]|nr:hypothetical protein [Paenibacillus sp.]
MFQIDRRTIKRDVGALGTAKKVNQGITVPTLADEYKKSVWNLMDTTNIMDAYSMMNWIIHVDRWRVNLGRTSITPYVRGDIVYVEWGAMNFGYEPSYEHPGVVISNGHNTVLVAPCSSQTYGKGHTGVFDLPTTDATGLTQDSGVSAGAIRWISKNRIINKAGEVHNPKILYNIEEFLAENTLLYQAIKAHHENEILDFTRREAQLQKELAETKAHLATAEGQAQLHSQQLADIKAEVRSFLREVDGLLQRRAPELIDAYREAASGKATFEP